MTGRPMQAPRALFCEMQERTSAAGRAYLVGWLGGSRFLGFWGEGSDRNGNPARILRLFVQEGDRKPQERQELQERQSSHPSASAAAARDQRKQEREHRAAMEMQARHDGLNDDIPY